MSRKATEECLRDVFQEYGVIEDVMIVRERGTQESKGVAFVKFSKASAAALAIEGMDGQLLKGSGDDIRPVRVSLAVSRGAQQGVQETAPVSIHSSSYEDRCRIFVTAPKGAELTEEGVDESFSCFGTIAKVQILRDSVGKSKGLAYINYERASSAAAAVDSFRDDPRDGLRVEIATPRSAKHMEPQLVDPRGGRFSGGRGVVGDHFQQRYITSPFPGMPPHHSLPPMHPNAPYRSGGGAATASYGRSAYDGGAGSLDYGYGSGGYASAVDPYMNTQNTPFANASLTSAPGMYGNSAGFGYGASATGGSGGYYPADEASTAGAGDRTRLFIMLPREMPSRALTESAVAEHFGVFPGLEYVQIVGGKNVGYVKYNSPAVAQQALLHFNQSDIYGYRVKVTLATERGAAGAGTKRSASSIS